MADATCDGRGSPGERCPDPAEAERKHRDVEKWYYSRVGTAPPRAKAARPGKAADQPKLF